MASASEFLSSFMNRFRNNNDEEDESNLLEENEWGDEDEEMLRELERNRSSIGEAINKLKSRKINRRFR